MHDVIAALIALVAYAAAAGKLAAVRRQPGARAPRALFWTLLALAVGWTFLVGPVGHAAEWATGVARSGQLLADAFALATGCGTQAMLVYLTHDDQTGRALMRPRLAALAVAVTAMIVVFLLWRPQELSGHLPVDYGISGFYLAYSAPYLTYLAYIFVGITHLCWRSARQAGEVPFLATGLRLIAAGGTAGLVYVSLRIGYIALARSTGSTRLGESYSALSDLVVAVVTVLVVVGATLPSWAPRLALYREVRQLSPLWHALIRRYPDLAVSPSPARLTDALPVGDVPRRRNRRVIEILDGRLELRRRFRPAVAAAARERAAKAGLRGHDLDATVEAARIAVALREKPEVLATAGHDSNSQPTIAAVGGGSDLDAEATWLRKVSTAFTRSPVVADVVADQADGPASRRSPADLAARIVTELTAPAPMLVALLLTVGGVSDSSLLRGLGWGLLAAVFFSLAPFAGILWGVLRGRVSDHHVSQRAQRPFVIVLSLVSFVTGYLTLRLGGAPRPLLAVMLALLAAAVICLLVTLFWKMSMHMAVAGCAAAVLTLLVGPVALAGGPALLVIAWSRVRLRDHTPSQVVAGAVTGALLAGAVFATAV
jgi:hypothetical protein